MMYVDPDGELAWFIPIIIGAAIGAGSYTASVAFSLGGFDNWDWFNFAFSTWAGAIGGGMSSGIGSAAASMQGLERFAFQTLAHSYSGGVMSVASGGNFGAGALSAGFGSLSARFAGALTSGMGNFAQGSAMIGAGALSGGVGAELAGGNFWAGAGQGLIVTGLNHWWHGIANKLISNTSRATGTITVAGGDEPGHFIPTAEATITTGVSTTRDDSIINLDVTTDMHEGTVSQTYSLGILEQRAGLSVSSNGQLSTYLESGSGSGALNVGLGMNPKYVELNIGISYNDNGYGLSLKIPNKTASIFPIFRIMRIGLPAATGVLVPALIKH